MTMAWDTVFGVVYPGADDQQRPRVRVIERLGHEVDVANDLHTIFDALIRSTDWRAGKVDAPAVSAVIRLGQHCRLATPDELAALVDSHLRAAVAATFEDEHLLCSKCGCIIYWEKRWQHYNFADDHHIGLWLTP